MAKDILPSNYPINRRSPLPSYRAYRNPLPTIAGAIAN